MRLLAVLRLTSSQKRLGLILDVEIPGDNVVKHEDSEILVVEKELAGSLQNVTLDV